MKKLIILFALVGCTKSVKAPELTPEQKAEAAEKALTVQLVKCTDDSDTREKAEACQDNVRAEWRKNRGAK